MVIAEGSARRAGYIDAARTLPVPPRRADVLALTGSRAKPYWTRKSSQ